MNIVIPHLFISVFLLLHTSYSFAQGQLKNQTIRGYITDRSTGNGLGNAYIKLLNYHPTISTISDREGYFELEDVPVGNQRLHVGAENYYEMVHSQLVVAGKQAVITIALEEQLLMKIITVEEKNNNKVNYKNTKLETVDEMNTVSAQPVNIEEVGRYISGFNDPVRAIANFSGLFSVDDSQNDLISRGNSSYGIQFLIEDVPINNPHHFAVLGATGGIFPLINTNALDNSDFANGALSAQYGNVYSGVFDAKLRRGNNRRHEFMGQISILGAELSAEGPFKKGKSSYMINIRGSIYDILQKLDFNVRTNSIPQYADVNFKVHLPTKKAGTFSIFGIGGLSAVILKNENIDSNDIFTERGLDTYVRTNTGLVGANHLYYLNKKTSLKTTLSYVNQDFYNKQDTFLTTGERVEHYEGKQAYQKIGIASIFNKKISSRFVLRIGLQGYLFFHNFTAIQLRTNILLYNGIGKQLQANAFVQAQYKFSQNWRMTLGLQAMYWSLSKNNWFVNPRIAVNWQPHPKHEFSLGYGLHSRTISPTLVYHVTPEKDGSYNSNNRTLNPLQSHHAVISYSWFLAKYWVIKANAYFQYQQDVPIEQKPSSFSAINNGPNQTTLLYNNLKNTGVGYNYGAELSLERFLGKGYYGLMTGGYQRAFYRGSDLIWRSSAFDVRYITSFLAGKEFKIGPQKRNIFYLDVRFNMRGGLPFIPIDLEASKQMRKQVLDMKQAYTSRVVDYKRIDFRVGLRLNHRKKRISHHIFLQALNVFSFVNEAEQLYLVDEERVVRTKQFGIFPNLMYQIRF